MNKSLVASVALAAAVAIGAVPAWSADESPATPAPAAAQPAQPGAMPPGGMGRGMGMDMDHPGGHHRMGMMPMMHMMRMMGARGTPQQRCEARLARRAAMVAYVVSLLDLTPQQQPLFAKVQTTMESTASKMHQLCAELKPATAQHPVTVLDRLKRREAFLEARLQGMKEAEPALQALYQALTPEQKAIVDHPFHRG